MLKSHNHSFGLLNAQYRSVLKRCLYLNLMASFAVFGFAGAAAAASIVVPEQSNEWDSGRSYEVNNGDLLSVIGGFDSKNSLSESFIKQENGSQVNIVGNEGSSTTVSNKTVILTEAGSGAYISGGFIQNSGAATAGSANNGNTFLNAVLDNNGIKISTDENTGIRVARGGLVADLGEATENSSYVDSKVMNNVQFNGNFVKIEDNTKSDGSFLQAKGGAFYIAGSAQISGTQTEGNYSTSFNENSAVVAADSSTANANRLAAGGAIYNDGRINIEGVKFAGNYAAADTAMGGAIYNEGVSSAADFSVVGSLIVENHVTVAKEGYGGAIYNKSKAGVVSTILQTSITHNYIEAADAEKAFGGAVYNTGNIADDGRVTSISQLVVETGGKDIFVSNNHINAGADTLSRGGAFYNSETGLFKVVASGDNTISFEGNSAKEGGAVYNAANNSNVGNILSSFQIDASSGKVKFTGNMADSGGVIYNAENAYFDIKSDAATTASGVSFSGNTASAAGGAVYNGKNGHITVDMKNASYLTFEENKAALGAGIYNAGGDVSISGSGDGSINFSKNTAEKAGGAIYNESGTVSIDSSANITFSENTAKVGGAIYNGADGTINISMDSAKNLDFASASDTIYNEGLLNIAGTSQATNEGIVKTNVNLSSDISGSGLLKGSDIVLNLNNAKIDASQKLDFSNSRINMNEGSELSVSVADNMSGANITTIKDAVLNYAALEQNETVVLADTLNHGGILNAQDGFVSNIKIDNLVGNGGWIYLDTDKDSQKSDVLTVSNSLTGSVNVSIKDIDDIAGKDAKIVFAQTNADQSTDDYDFKFNFDDSVFVGQINSVVSNNIREWYLNYDGEIRREAYNSVILPRAMVEQTRDIRLDTSRNNNSPRIRYEYGYRNTLRKVDDKNKKVSLWVNPVYRQASMSAMAESNADIWGVDFGLNMNITPSSKTGLLVSYRKGSYDKDGTSGEFYTRGAGDLDISSTLVGLYYNKYFSRFYFSGMVYGGEQKADMSATDNNVSASAKALQAGAKVEAGYEAPVTDRFSITPLASASYDYIKIDDSTDSSGKTASYDAIQDVELEAGLKFGYKFNNDHQLPTNGYIKTSVVQLLENGGKVQIKNVEFDTLKNETAGRLEIGGEAALLENFVVGGFGNYTIGSDYSGFAVGGNVRYTW